MVKENDILKIDNGTFEEEQITLGDYRIKFQLKEDVLDISSDENVIEISARNINNNELFIYKTIVKYEDSKTFGKLFIFCDDIKEVYDVFSNSIKDKKIKIEEIVHGKFINFSIEFYLQLYNKNVSASIKLLKSDFTKDEVMELIDNYQTRIERLNEKNSIYKKILEEKDQSINNLETSIKFLIEYVESINEGNNDDETLLFYVCKYGNENLVKLLIENGTDININKENKYAETPIFYALLNGNENIVKYLIEQGADINKKNYNNETPIFYACKSGDESLVTYFTEYEENININTNIKNNNEKKQKLYPDKNRNENLVKYLVDLGADINLENNDSETPLFYACKSGNENIVKYLIKKIGLDINKENDFGETPLFYAIESGNEDLVKYLVEELRANINKKNKSGETPIFYAYKNENENMVKYLIEHGADINIWNRYKHKK
eukprot:jgi/Orpsp1_1/1181222/evm.model.c7180000076346.1